MLYPSRRVVYSLGSSGIARVASPLRVWAMLMSW